MSRHAAPASRSRARRARRGGRSLRWRSHWWARWRGRRGRRSGRAPSPPETTGEQRGGLYRVQPETGPAVGVPGQAVPRSAQEVLGEGVPVAGEGRDQSAVGARVLGPSDMALSPTDRVSTAAVPSGNGWARDSCGWSHSRPCRASGIALKAGDPTASGCTAEHGSWRKPGRVSSSVRAPPPTVSPASNNSTAKPRRASSTAAVSPLGPAPTTTASSIDGTFGLLCQPVAGGPRIFGGGDDGPPGSLSHDEPRVRTLSLVRAMASRLARSPSVEAVVLAGAGPAARTAPTPTGIWASTTGAPRTWPPSPPWRPRPRGRRPRSRGRGAGAPG